MKYTFPPDELALLQEVHANPMNDAPKLAYAEWLDNHGSADFASYIRRSCAEPNAWPSFGTMDQLRAWAKPMPRGLDLHFERGIPVTWLYPNRCTQARLDQVDRTMSPRVGIILMLKERTLLHPVVGAAIFDHPIMRRVVRLRIVPNASNMPQQFVEGLLALRLPQHRPEMSFSILHADVEPLVREKFGARYPVVIDYLTPATH